MILGGEAGDVIDTGGARLLQLAAVIVADAVFVPGDRGGGSEKIKGGIGLSVGGKLHRFNVVQQPAELLHDLDASRGGRLCRSWRRNWFSLRSWRLALQKKTAWSNAARMLSALEVIRKALTSISLAAV